MGSIIAAVLTFIGYKKTEKWTDIQTDKFIYRCCCRFVVTALKGEGGFAKVYSAKTQPNDLNCTIAGIDAVLKVRYF